MQTFLKQFNHVFAKAPLLFISQRWLILIIFLCSTGYLTFAMITKFSMDMSLESWFREDDPAKTSLDRFRHQFGSDDGVYLVYRPKDGNVFSPESVAMLESLHQAIDNKRFREEGSELKRIDRIDSLYNARYLLAQGDTLISERLFQGNIPQSSQGWEQRKQIATEQNTFKLAYFSNDFSTGGIRIKTDFGTLVAEDLQQGDDQKSLLEDDDFVLDEGFDPDNTTNVEAQDIDYLDTQMDEYLDFMTALREITESEQFKDVEFYYTGNAPMMEFAMQSMAQAGGLIGLMMLIVIVLLWILFKSLSAVFWPCVVIAASAIWTIGGGSLIGVTFSNMVSLTFMLVLAVGLADCVHVLSAYSFYRRQKLPHRQAMSKAYVKTGIPILLTTITTMAGMSALLVSDIPQIGVFGLSSAVAVAMAFLMTVFVLPVLLDIWHPYRKVSPSEVEANESHWLQNALDKIPDFVSKRPKTIVAIYFGAFALLVYGATQVKVDSNFAELTKEGSSIRVTYELVDKKMMGGQNMEIMLDLNQEDALKSPQVLKQIEKLQRHIEDQYPKFVVKTFSLADFVKDTHKVLNQGQEAYYHIPDDPRLVAQLVYMFDNASPEDRKLLVSDDYSKSHISLQLKNAGSYEYTQFFNAVRADIEQFLSADALKVDKAQSEATGSLALMMELIDHISWTQIKSFSFAMVIIVIIMMLTLGSVQAGLISIIPNLLPAFFTFGVMGLAGIPLDTDTLIIAPLIIGIAVDDTIHFVAHYRDAWFRTQDVDHALRSTIKEVGQAVTFTTLILGIGFSMLAFSDYLGLAKTGIFGSMAIFVALSSDLFLLPALIKWLKPNLGLKNQPGHSNPSLEV